MKLLKAQIKNFRSIKECTVTFEPRGLILVGINESGKSNILKALSLLSPSVEPKPEDVRYELPDEVVESAFVQFHFFLEEDDQTVADDAFNSKILGGGKNRLFLVDSSKQNLSSKAIIGKHNDFLYVVDLKNADKSAKYWKLVEQHTKYGTWKKPSKKCPDDLEVAKEDGTKVLLKDLYLIDQNLTTELDPTVIEEPTPEYIYQCIASECLKVVKKNLPDTIFWSYSEKNLLPPSVGIEEFCANPDICIPLKNMFILAGKPNIKEAIESARNRPTTSPFINLLSKVAEQTTQHFKEVWKEYRDIQFDLLPDGDKIIATVLEKNRYDFSQRSDGFKRFVSFLLLISVNVKTDHLKNTLILIDEPDMSLHPSGSRYLRDELIKISAKNNLLFSTHSIFMIDPNRIDRHIIVKKKDEITTIETAEDSNIVDEEVLFNSLGYSVFSILKQKNLIFEGWTDKQLFDVALSRVPNQYSSVKTLKDIGICYAKGVKQIKSITPMIELAKRECFILSDADAPARQHQNDFQQNSHYGQWKRYDELLTTHTVITAEDFVKDSAIQVQIEALRADDSSLPQFNQASLNNPSGKLSAVNQWLAQSGYQGDRLRHSLESLKGKLFEQLRSSEIELYYYEMLNSLNSIINPPSTT